MEVLEGRSGSVSADRAKCRKVWSDLDVLGHTATGNTA